MTSRTFNIAIETSAKSCHRHRLIRKIEREFIRSRSTLPKDKCSYQLWKEQKKEKDNIENKRVAEGNKKRKKDVYDLSFSCSEREVWITVYFYLKTLRLSLDLLMSVFGEHRAMTASC